MWLTLLAQNKNPLLFCWEPGLKRRCTLLVQGERRSRLGAPEQSQQAAPRLSGRRPPTGAERGLLLLLLIAASVAAVHLAPTYTGAFQHMRVHTGRRAQQHSMGLGDAADAGASAGSGSGEHHSGITRTLSFDVCHGFGHQRLSLLSGAALPAAVAAEPARRFQAVAELSQWHPALPSPSLACLSAALRPLPPALPGLAGMVLAVDLNRTMVLPHWLLNGTKGPGSAVFGCVALAGAWGAGGSGHCPIALRARSPVEEAQLQA